MDDKRQLGAVRKTGSASNSNVERTVDNIPDRERSLISGCRTSFAPSIQDKESELFGESFKPAKWMGSKLLADLCSWEEPFTRIPSDLKSFSDLSAEYLQKQRANKSDAERINSILQSSKGNTDDKTFSRYIRPIEKPPKDRESKNTEADNSSHFLSMSAIEKVLNEINSEDSIDLAQATKSPSTNREKEQAGKNLLQVPSSTLAGSMCLLSWTGLDGRNAFDQEVAARRSRSPSKHLESTVTCGLKTFPGIVKPSKLQEFRANSSSPSSDHTMTETDRRFLMDSKSPDFGNYAIKSKCNSQCSSSSEFSHHNGKLPIKVNVLELSWGSVKLRKTAHKSIEIKNTSFKRLHMRVTVSGPGFQLSASTSESSKQITLHSQECRTLNLSFCPTVIGAAAGQLLFLAPYGGESVTIQLYGYGVLAVGH